MTPGKINLTIYKGATFSKELKWETSELAYIPITGIANSAPCNITAVAHGLPDGWRFFVQGAKGLTNLNAKKSPPADSDFYKAVVIDSDNIQINAVNALDFPVYTSGGVVCYRVPMDLAGATARLKVKDMAGGVELMSLTTENGGIEIDNLLKTITLKVSAADTTLIDFSKGVYDMEIVFGTEVHKFAAGEVAIVEEITT